MLIFIHLLYWTGSRADVLPKFLFLIHPAGQWACKKKKKIRHTVYAMEGHTGGHGGAKEIQFQIKQGSVPCLSASSHADYL